MPDTITKKDRDNILRMKDEDTIALVKSDYSIAKEKRSKPNKRNRRYRKMYFQKEDAPAVGKKDDPKGATEGRSHIWIGVVRAIVDTAIAAIIGSICSVDPFVKIEPTEIGDEEASQQFENLFAYRSSRHQMNLKHLLESQWLFQACLYDYAIGRVGWLIKTGYVPHTTLVEKIVKLAKIGLVFPRTVEKTEFIPKRDAVEQMWIR